MARCLASKSAVLAAYLIAGIGISLAACGGEPLSDNPDAGRSQADATESGDEGPCPCDGDAECREETGEELCVVPRGGACDGGDYQCDEGLACESSTCVGEEGFECDESRQCRSELECRDQKCSETYCETGTQCPEDGDSDSVRQPHCNREGEGCVQCRYWQDESTNFGSDDCPDGEICTSIGFCADPIRVPRQEPVDTSLAEEEALAIATAVCSFDTDDHKTNTGRANAMCGSLVMEGADKSLAEDDVRPRAIEDEFRYLESAGPVDGYEGAAVADEIPELWETSFSVDRVSWFAGDASDIDEISSDSRGEICIWMGARRAGPWRIGIDTCEAYYARGYVNDWDEDGE